MDMDRRSFVEAVSGMGLLASAGSAQTSAQSKTRIYMMETYYFKQGSQPARFHEYMSKAALPALSKVHSGPKLVMDALVGPHTPQTIVILGFQSVQELWAVRGKLNLDQELDKAYQEWQSGPEAPFEQQVNTLLESTDYAHEMVALDPPPGKPRIFELRVYHSPSYRTLKSLHERFAGPEGKLFHKSGIHPILYSSTVIGPNMPNLTYLTPFEDLATREKAWDTFGSDPEWLKVRQDWITKNGQVTTHNEILLYRATAYSPIR